MRVLTAIMVAATAVSRRVAAAVPAVADSPCAEFDNRQYRPNAYNNGRLQPSWELPGG